MQRVRAEVERPRRVFHALLLPVGPERWRSACNLQVRQSRSDGADMERPRRLRHALFIVQPAASASRAPCHANCQQQRVRRERIHRLICIFFLEHLVDFTQI
jgi:hypothetical protein